MFFLFLLRLEENLVVSDHPQDLDDLTTLFPSNKGMKGTRCLVMSGFNEDRVTMVRDKKLKELPLT